MFWRATHKVNFPAWHGDPLVMVRVTTLPKYPGCKYVQDSKGNAGWLHECYLTPIEHSKEKTVTEEINLDLPTLPTFTAPEMLQKASQLMIERGVQYDSPEGERSMEKIVNAFNAVTGHELTEAHGWMFMVFLKLVRDDTRKVGHQDSCEDLIAYASLYGESRLAK